MKMQFLTHWKESHHVSQRTQDNVMFVIFIVVGIPLAVIGIKMLVDGVFLLLSH
jgi:hypothetical protein